MFMLGMGLLIWVAVHLSASVFPATRQSLIARLGNMAYQSVFALCILAGLLLIIFGWRNALTTQIYAPSVALREPAMLLVVAGFILMAAANFPATRIKRLIRHPQLSGVLLWAIAHLLMNGDSRSLLVFSVIGLWALVSMLTINHRDGAWVRPDPPAGWVPEVFIVGAGIVVAVLAVYFHEYLAGVPLVG
jgi:uncharacterized membrane protein